MSTQLLDSEIKYDRISRDYSILIGDQIVASAPNYSAAELLRTQLLSERIQGGCYATVPDGTDPDDFSDVPAGPGEPKRADSAVRSRLTFGHLRRDLFAPTLFCACGARATIVRYGESDVYLCDRCHAAEQALALVNWSN